MTIITREEDFKQRVLKVFGEQLGQRPDTIEFNASLNELGADSLDAVELVMNTEDEFGVEICDEDAEKLKSPADFHTYLTTNDRARNAK